MSIESRAANRVGLARLRPLAARSNSKQIQNVVPNSKTNGTVNQNSNNGSNNKNNITDLPDGWYFNETREKDFWEDIERGQARKIDESDAKSLMMKKNEQITDLQNTSSKIRGLVDQFDEIDQDTLMILMQLYDDGYGVSEDLDQQMIMNDSKTHVLDFMTQLKGLSDSQTSLMENLRFFFSTLQLHSTNGDSEDISNEEIPDVDYTYEQLSSLLREYAEKSEHASCLHNDINDFWFKQISNYKRIVLIRDDEIRKLQKTINDIHVATQARRTRKKNDLDKTNDGSKIDVISKDQLDNQIRLNNELKQQIDHLKAALKEGDVQNATLNATIVDSSLEGIRANKDSLLKENDINALKIEFETKLSSNNATIEQLLKQIEHLKKLMCDQEIKYDELSYKYNEIEKERDELSQALQKQIKLLEIEQQRNSEKPEIEQDDKIDRQELYEAEMRHQNEIREMIEKHRNELLNATEEARENFIKERQKIIDNIENGDTKSLIESISTECEMRIQKQKEEYETKEKGLVQVWAGKVALLTRQYENRIKAITASYEVDLLMAKDAVRYEVQKAELDIEEKYNLQLLEMGRERKEKYEQFNKQLDKLTNDLDMAKEDNKLLRAQLKVYTKDDQNEQNISESNSPESETKKEEKKEVEENKKSKESKETKTTKVTKENKVTKETKENKVANENKESKKDVPKENNAFILSEKEQLMEKYAMKMKIMKQEMDDQMSWALDKQKNYYEREISRVMIQHQKEMRERLMELQEVIAQSNYEIKPTRSKSKLKQKAKPKPSNDETKITTIDENVEYKPENNETKAETNENKTENKTENNENESENKTESADNNDSMIKNNEEEEIEEEDGEEKVYTIMREISQAFFNMNSQFEKLDEIGEEPTMTVKEAAERTKVLTDRLIQLSSENQDLKSSQIFTESSESIIQKLKERLSYMESIQSGDIKSAVEKMNQMEAQYKHELEVKDQMLLNFQRLNEMFTKISQNKIEECANYDIQVPTDLHLNNDSENEPIQFTESLVKPPIGEINSAPIEYTTLKKPTETNTSNTSRKKPMRMHSHQNTQSVTANIISISNINHLFEIEESPLSPLQFKPTAFLIDEELHQIVMKELVPKHKEDERTLVSNVIDEVFARLPLSKTNEALSSHSFADKSVSESEQESEIPSSISNRSMTVVSQMVSPRQKSLNSSDKHYSFVVIQSFFIPLPPKDKKEPESPAIATNIAFQNNGDKKDNNNNNFIYLSVSNEPIDEPEIEGNGKTSGLHISLNSVIELINPQFENLFDENGNLKVVKKGPVTKLNYSSYSTKQKPKPKQPQQQQQPKQTSNEPKEQHQNQNQNQHQNQHQNQNQENNELQQQTEQKQSLSVDDDNSISPNSEEGHDEEEESAILFTPSIDNEVVIDIPYVLYTNDELQTEVQTHILNLEKEISELKGRPLPTQVVNTYVPREVNPDQRQITLQLYMPLTGEESKKLREERKRRHSKEPSTKSKLNLDENNKENNNNKEEEETKKPGLSFIEPEKVDEGEIHHHHQTKLGEENGKRTKSMAVIDQNKQEKIETIMHAESQLALTRDLSNLSFETDPFSAAKQIITSNIMCTHKFTSTEGELLKSLNQSMEAYDAYVTASGLTDESYFSFLNNLKQSKKDLDANHSLSFQINIANDSLFKRINQMISAYEKVTKRLAELEVESENQNIALQKEILDSIATSREDDQSTPQANLEKLHKLESSLDLLENLGLIKDPELITQKETLLEEIKSKQEKITSNDEVVSQEEIDQLIVKTQDFIGGIKTIKSRPSSPNDKDKDNDYQTREQMKKDLSRIRHQRDSLKKNLNREKERTEELQQQIISLNNKIESERENFNSDLLSYKAQIDALKSSFSVEGQSAVDILKQQLMSMQALAESSRNERDLFKGKLDDAEEALLLKEETIDKLNQQIQTLLQNDFEKSQEIEYNNLMSKKKSKSDNYDMSKEVNKLNEELQMQQAKQMETMMAENKKLTEECNKLNQKIIKLKQKLRSVKEANADMNLRFALGYDPKNEKRSDKATQYPPASFLNLDEEDEKSKSNLNKNKENSTKSKESIIKLSPSQALKIQKENEEKERNELNNDKNNEDKENETINKDDENDKINNNENEENENEQNEEQFEEEEENEQNEEQNENDIQGSSQNMCDSYDTFDSYEELDTVGDILLKMPDDKSDESKYEFGDIAPRVHDPIYLPKKKKKTSIMILNNTKPKTQKSGKRIQPQILHHLPGGPSIETKLKEREEDLKSLTINNQPQGKRYLTGTTQPVKPTTSVLKSNGTRNCIPIFDQDGNQIEVGNENQMPIIESSFKLSTFSEEYAGSSSSMTNNNNSQTTSNSTLNRLKNNKNEMNSMSKETQKNAAKTTSYIIDKSLQSNPIAPLRITLVVHEKDKDKEQRKSLNGNVPMIIPVQNENPLKRMVTPLGNYSKNQPQAVVGRPIDKAPIISEAQKIINKLRESKRRLQATNDQKDIEIVNLKQKLSELTLAIHRLKLDNIKKADDFKRLSIRYEYSQNRLEVRATEIAVKDEEIQKLKRELVVLRMQVQPVNQQLAKLKNAQRERDRLKREQERRNQVAIATKNALLGSKNTNDTTRKHLQTILDNQRASIARLEAQRRMWADIERNHMMGVLSAMSLLSTSQYKIVRGVLPSYSPFSQSKVTTLKQILEMNNNTDSTTTTNNKNNRISNFNNRKRADFYYDFSDDSKKNGNEIFTNNNIFSYADKLNALDKIEPPLSKEEKEMVILQRESPEIEQKIISLLKAERDKNTMSKVKIDTNAIGSNS